MKKYTTVDLKDLAKEYFQLQKKLNEDNGGVPDPMIFITLNMFIEYLES